MFPTPSLPQILSFDTVFIDEQGPNALGNTADGGPQPPAATADVSPSPSDDTVEAVEGRPSRHRVPPGVGDWSLAYLLPDYDLLGGPLSDRSAPERRGLRSSGPSPSRAQTRRRLAADAHKRSHSLFKHSSGSPPSLTPPPAAEEGSNPRSLSPFYCSVAVIFPNVSMGADTVVQSAPNGHVGAPVTPSLSLLEADSACQSAGTSIGQSVSTKALVPEWLCLPQYSPRPFTHMQVPCALLFRVSGHPQLSFALFLSRPYLALAGMECRARLRL